MTCQARRDVTENLQGLTVDDHQLAVDEMGDRNVRKIEPVRGCRRQVPYRYLVHRNVGARATRSGGKYRTGAKIPDVSGEHFGPFPDNANRGRLSDAPFPGARLANHIAQCKEFTLAPLAQIGNGEHIAES